MSSTRQWRLAAAAGLAAATLALSIAGLAGLSPVGHVGGLAEGHDRRAYRLLAAPRGAVDLDGAAAEANRALRLSPYDNSARLRLAYIDALRHGSLRAEGVTHIKQSYDLMPYDHTVAAWRIRFCLENWASLTPQVRASVHDEAMAFARVYSHDVNVRDILRSIRSPNGRLAAALWLYSLHD